MLEHGGKLRDAAQQFNIPLEQWLDLSTGINPHGYPASIVPAEVWGRLPEYDDGLEKAAADYYGSASLLPVAGSQAAIQTLPKILAGNRITLLQPTYNEHPHAWRQRQICLCKPQEIDTALPNTDVLIIVNPNNPSGSYFSPEQLLEWQRQLAGHEGWLIVDEAFVDATPEYSLIRHGERENLIVLRSLGKFFGLAGARVGFVFAPAAVRHRLAQQLGPWTLSGPARYVAQKALSDIAWQQETKNRLTGAAARLRKLIEDSGLGKPSGTPLFQWVTTPRAEQIYHHFAQQGILLRKFAEPVSIRFGLPADEADWQRLQHALATFS